MTPEQQAILREEFQPDLVGKNQDGLDFVGHAAVTDRLLKADPDWSWDFQATEPTGAPVISMRSKGTKKDKRGNEYEMFFATMWIRLTVGGVTRPAVGGCDVYPWTDDIGKLLISDAIKNGAMRFGVALDLWSKEDLHAEPCITVEQEAQVRALFDRLEGEALDAAKAAFGSQLGMKLHDVPRSRFDEVYSWAMDAVDPTYPNPDEGDK